MKAAFSGYLNSIAPAVKELIRLLGDHYDYVSVLSTDSAGFSAMISQRAKAVSNSTMFTERGNVVRVQKNGLYSEYAFNGFDTDRVPELAEEIKKRMFVFEDIVMIGDRDIQKVLREVDGQQLAKALKSVDTEVQDKIFRNMSKRQASMLKEDMEYMGPVRLKDVEEAQQKVVSVIRRLEDSGEIVIARGDGDEYIN